jgi:hypothetical protein
MQFDKKPHTYEKSPLSPELEEGKESLGLALSSLEMSGGHVSVLFHVTYWFPTTVRDRYDRLNEAIHVVFHDLDQQDGFALRTDNDFMTFPKGSRDGPNQLAPPPLPLAPRGDPKGAAYAGGWIHGGATFPAPRPLRRPSVYVHAVLENYVSNVVALDLVEPNIITF